MSSSVSLEYLNLLVDNNGTWFTTEGGIYQTFINATGGVSVKGTLVQSSFTVNNAVETTPPDFSMPIGVIYEDGIANGAPVKVVTYGRAEVLLKDGVASTRGYWCGVSDQAGRMYQAVTVPAATEHFREIGHSLETVAGGTDVLATVTLHFN